MNFLKGLLGVVLGALILSSSFMGEKDFRKNLVDSGVQLSVKRESEYFRVGTGFTVSSGGSLGIKYTVTNAHVCNVGGDHMYGSSTYGSENKYLKILKIDFAHDLCLLTGLNNTKSLAISEYEPVEGDSVSVFGFPASYKGTWTKGEYVGKDVTQLLVDVPSVEECFNRGFEYKLFAGCVASINSYNVTVPIYGGNSGSPLVNSRGEVIGVIFARDTRYTLMASAIPLTDLKTFLLDYYNHGK